MFVGGENTMNDDHHVGIYWGDGHSDVLWHSSVNLKQNAITKITPLRDTNITYVAIKAGGYSAPGLDTPRLDTIDADEGGINLTWDAVPGAVKYRVFRYDVINSKWKKPGDTIGTSWVDSTAEQIGSYTYTVRCVSYDGSIFTSGYDKNGITYTYLDTFEPTESINEKETIKESITFENKRSITFENKRFS